MFRADLVIRWLGSQGPKSRRKKIRGHPDRGGVHVAEEKCMWQRRSHAAGEECMQQGRSACGRGGVHAAGVFGVASLHLSPNTPRGNTNQKTPKLLGICKALSLDTVPTACGVVGDPLFPLPLFNFARDVHKKVLAEVAY